MAARELTVPEFSAIVRVDLKPGDIVVLRFRGQLTAQAVARLRQICSEVIPDHKCLVLEGGADISLLSAAELNAKLAGSAA